MYTYRALTLLLLIIMNRLLSRLFPLFLIIFFSVGCAISKNPYHQELKLLQKGIIKDDSSFIYQLPFQPNETHFLVQGYFSRYSHKNRAALDFKMKPGTPIYAARTGTLLRLKEDGNKGGWKRKYRRDGNYIVIQHNDSSRAGYWHLQYNGVLVNVGDSVLQGQVIGISGKTGYALFPHLHFIVWRFNKTGNWRQVGTRFKTSKGIRYLRPFRNYTHN